MRLSYPLVLALLPGVAFAGPSPSWGVDGAGSVEIAGPVEVPLYRGPVTGYLPAVWASAPKGEEGETVGAFAVVDLGAGWSQVSKSFAGKLGLKVKKGDFEHAVVPELRVGDVVLRDVRVQVVPSGPSIVLGAGTLEEVAVAVLPSKGVVKLVPAAQADALLQEVGSPVAVTRIAAKPWWEHGVKKTGNGVSFAVEGAVVGTTGQLQLRTAESSSWVGPQVALTADRTVGGVPYAVVEATAGGAALPSTWFGRHGGIADPEGAVVGRLGYDTLYAADVAIDPAGSRVAIKPATDVKAEEPAARALEASRAEYELEKKKLAEKPAEPGDADASTSFDAGKPAEFGLELKLAGDLLAANETKEALDHYRAAVAVAGDNCQPYLELGRALVKTGAPDEAVAQLQKAGELWDRWYAQDLDTRKRVQAKKGVGDEVFALAQPSVCHEAWGDLAGAYLATGAHGKVAEVHDAHVDLDDRLPQIYGLSLLAQGKLEEANGPLRQAVNMGGRNSSQVRVALGLAHANESAVEVLAAQVDRVETLDDDDSWVSLLPLIEAGRAAKGDAAALALAEEITTRDPLSVQAAVLYARELKRAGETDKLEKALAALPAQLDRLGDLYVNSAVDEAYGAIATALRGDAAAATKAIEDAERAYGQQPVLFMARALVAESAGDAAATDNALAELQRRSPSLAVGVVTLGSGG